MANLLLYKRVLSVSNFEGLVALFLQTLAETNRTFDFFVDWEKVRRNVESVKVELALLGSVLGSRAPEEELRAILSRYPEAARAIPILVAIRKQVKVLDDVDSADKYLRIDFGKSQLTGEEIKAIVRFCTRTGLLDFLHNLRALPDYAAGVEVGMDTNARKNRSGGTMERLVFPLVSDLAKRNQKLQVVTGKSFGALETRYAVGIPSGLRNRIFDVAAFIKGSFYVNIETNFFTGSGSKPQEIVDSYIQRERELEDAGWSFVWVTDGDGWRVQVNQLRKALEKMSFVLNAEFLRRGMLQTIFDNLQGGKSVS